MRTPGGPRWREATCWLLGLAFLVGCGVAAYHAGAEWKFWPGPTACASTGGGVSAADMAAFLKGAPVRPPACDEAPWVFLWQQHDLYGVAQTIEWSPRADEKMWMYDAKVVAK